MNLIKKSVYRDIDCLKRNKTTGLDGIIDLFIDCKDVLVPVLLRLFILSMTMVFILNSGQMM